MTDHANTQTHAEVGTALPLIDDTEQSGAPKEKPVTWLSLPRKDQLAVLTLARLSEPLTQTSLGSYVFYQLQSFDPDLPDSTIAYQAGLLHAAFPGAQFLTAILWGRFADAEYGGRKRAISLGLLGTMVSIVGFGFSNSFSVALFFRCLGGVLNGNIGVMRTMISEIIKEKKFQSRAFLLLPMTFNIGVIIGPILGTSYFYCLFTKALIDDERWDSGGSSRKLSVNLWARVMAWGKEWCPLDDQISICFA